MGWILVGILFRPIAFEGLRGIIIFLTSFPSVRLRKKELILIGARKSWKLFLEYLTEDWMSVATFPKCLVKALTISCGSVKLWTLSKVLDGAIVDYFFKDISFFIPFHVVFRSFRLFCK